ncbi:hypothetical protein PVAG01_06555 [Phlyctema vagabunda]|uniref:Uncharacterized protein n=1 Tax=Phlyctema vagabunda TaxID=108571 RepID=A0ABR4PGE6_9HELO
MATNDYPTAEGLQVDDRPTMYHQAQHEKITVPAQPYSSYNTPPGAYFAGGMEGLEVVENSEKRYFGMRPKTFWIVLGVLCLVVVGGAVGGGVGGSLASRSSNDSGSSSISEPASLTATTTTAASASSLTPTSSTLLSTSSSTTTTSSSSTSSTTSSTISPNTLPCPTSVSCANENCNGRNSPNGRGRCLSGVYSSCSCDSTCGAVNGPCNNCDGRSNPVTRQGVCESGFNFGCNCASVCGEVDGPCSDCGGQSGVCEAGSAKGCNCDPAT